MIRSAVASALLLLLAGCYTLRRAGGVVPEIGQELAFDLNDVGRVALGGSMGPEIAQIEGRLLSRENGEYLVAVRSLRTLRGGEQVWRGEPVRIRAEHVGTTYQREFSRGRTFALGAAGLGAVAFVLTRSLTGSGNEEPPGQGPPGGTAQRVP